MRVVAFAPGLASREVDLVAAQEPPNILNVNIAKFPGQRANPAGGGLSSNFRMRLSVDIV
jgi:hypothetical protein